MVTAAVEGGQQHAGREGEFPVAPLQRIDSKGTDDLYARHRGFGDRKEETVLPFALLPAGAPFHLVADEQRIAADFAAQPRAFRRLLRTERLEHAGQKRKEKTKGFVHISIRLCS